MTVSKSQRLEQTYRKGVTVIGKWPTWRVSHPLTTLCLTLSRELQNLFVNSLQRGTIFLCRLSTGARLSKTSLSLSLSLSLSVCLALPLSMTKVSV
jgi:hypothetical protein